MALLSAPSLNSRFTQLVIAAACLISLIVFLTPAFGVQRHISIPGLPSLSSSKADPPAPKKPKPHHPIDDLIRDADKELSDLLAKETTNVHDAAEVYRKRRGRQPPPGFDLWFKFAQEKSALVIEEFFDQIYDDLNPFWGIPAKQIREEATVAVHRVSVRNHVTSQRTDVDERVWLNLWQSLVDTIAQYLPDIDMPINEMDESRVIVPWEDIDAYVQKGRESLAIVPREQLKDEYQSLEYLDKDVPPDFDHGYTHEGPYWQLAVVGCPPDSPARRYKAETDYTTPPPLSGQWPEQSYHGYVKNWTFARSPCDNPHFQGLHGTFIEPLSLATTKKLIPLFGGSKLPMNNGILVPAFMYWTDDPFYSGGKDHGEAWKEKKDMMIWRGAASGGRNRKTNWTRFQRHRFMAMVNGTSVSRAEMQSEDPPPNFVLPENNYDLATPLGPWIDSFSDTAFVNKLCFPKPPPEMKGMCEYTDPWFELKPTMPMKEQYNYKYLPDIDGNSFSGRYRGFLGSTSLPIKATIYQEWHDSRLVPWKHFVPMDNTFIDIWGIMQYFLGNKEAGIEGHDDEAKEIAIGGKKWAEKVLRKEDMQVYVFRLLLEYARVCDDDREIMGWREDSIAGDGVT